MTKLVLRSAKKRRSKRVRAKIKAFGRGRKLSVFRSNRCIYGQIIDLTSGKTLVAISDRVLSKEDKKISGLTKKEKAFEVGKKLAELALKLKIGKIVFDRGPFLYHGRVKSLAEGARQGGLKF
ncbi:50S ribosomal protein L18 [Patescibacteria group bacterium]|nr:50S ribosomal protein L18 [Patescibacteria group bacterium]